jgi:glycosyltransferase involved in cell wall biosynthesis
VSSGVDLEQFNVAPAPNGPPRFLCVGALEERKNVVRLADAFAQLPDGTLAFVGDGPLRAWLEGRERVELLGRRPHGDVPALLAASHVLCQPSLIEPLGQALLEGMASGRSVVATRMAARPIVTPHPGRPADVEAGCPSWVALRPTGTPRTRRGRAQTWDWVAVDLRTPNARR